MELTRLNYRLKGQSEVRSVNFASPQEAQQYLLDNGLQVVVGDTEGIPNAHVLFEKAAATAKADWHEFYHITEE